MHNLIVTDSNNKWHACPEQLSRLNKEQTRQPLVRCRRIGPL